MILPLITKCLNHLLLAVTVFAVCRNAPDPPPCSSWRCRARSAQSCSLHFLPTCFPCSILFCVPAAEWQLCGSKTPRSSLLHGYRQSWPAIGSKSAEPATHWLSGWKNGASIGCRGASGLQPLVWPDSSSSLETGRV